MLAAAGVAGEVVVADNGSTGSPALAACARAEAVRSVCPFVSVTEPVPSTTTTSSPADRRARRHADLLTAAARDGLRDAPRGALDRGAAWQRQRRERDHGVRRHALAVIRWASWHGWDDARCASALGVSARALRAWRHTIGRPPKPLGAPAGSSTPAQRRACFDFLTQWGTDVGLPTLHDHFPELARGECARLLWLARCRVYRV